MSEIIIENLPNDVEKTTISFEEEPGADELPIKDAEILKETRREPEKEVQIVDDFSIFLASLPEDSNPTIIIVRQPDRNYSGQFRIACESQEHSGTLNWNNYTDASEIYNDIAKKFGGGRYSIQVKDGQRFEKNRTWTTTIADPVHLSEKEKTLLELKTKSEEQPRKTESSQVFANSQQPSEPKNFLREAIEQMKELREFQEFLSPTPPPAAEQTAAQPPTITKETIKMALIEKALNNPDLVEKAIEAVFDIPADAPETQGSAIVEIFKYAATHQTETKAIFDLAFSSVGALFSNLIPKPPVSIPTQVVPNGLQRFKRPPDAPTQSPMPETAPQVEPEQKNDDAPGVHIPEIEPFPFIALEG